MPLVPGRTARAESFAPPVYLRVPRGQQTAADIQAHWPLPRSGPKHMRGRKRAGDNESLIFVCELGPPPYAITDKNGDELTDRWDEALLLRETVAQLWKTL
jgi:hypothetical protein